MVLALNSMHWQGMLLSCPAGAVQKVWPWQRMPPSAEPDNRWQVVVKHRIQHVRIGYQRQILHLTYTPEIVWHFLRIQMYFQTMQFLGSPIVVEDILFAWDINLCRLIIGTDRYTLVFVMEAFTCLMDIVGFFKRASDTE